MIPEFRGLTNNGQWVYGSVLFTKNPDRAAIFPWDRPGMIPMDIIPETVGQYIGVKDKNGKDLDWWGGDIVVGVKTRVTKGYSPGEIYYNETRGAWWVFALDESYNQPLEFGSWWNKVGNKWENPELIK